MKLERERVVDDAEDERPERPAAPASEVADLRLHLARTRLRVALESLESAERLLRAHGGHSEADQENARVLVDSARRELESLKSLVRGDGTGVV